MKPINIKEKFNQFNSHWHPHQVAVVDNMQVLLAKVQGKFVWHNHKEEDELFYVQKGTLEMHFRVPNKNSKTKNISVEKNDPKFIQWVEIIKEGEIIVVPKGVEHCPKTHADEEVYLLLFEKLSTAHTGNVISDKTQTDYPVI